MKLKPGILTHSTGDEQILVSADKNVFSGIVRSNKTAAYIVDLLKEDTTADAIKAALLEKYDAPEEVISADVDKVLEQLRSINVLED